MIPRSSLQRFLLLGTLAAACSLGCATAEGARAFRAGTRALEVGDAGAAIVSLERAARLVPEASEIHNHLGLAYWADGRTGEAEHALERALVLDCDNRAARHNLDLLRRAALLDGEKPIP